MDKRFKIWGVSYGLVGDLIMGLPVLEYYENKYPGSYKLWVIEKKVAFMAPFFLNHPLIDKIHISEKWGGFGDNDLKVYDKCNIGCTFEGWKHSSPDWYNRVDCVDETAYIAGIKDLELTPLQKYPKLNRWFPVGNPRVTNTYDKEGPKDEVNDNIISILPVIGPNDNTGKSPCREWWGRLVYMLGGMGYNVWQFGYPGDIEIDGAVYCNAYTYFEQVQMMLSTRMSIGTDSGNMWVLGAYSHPCIHLMTDWLPDHHSNHFALEPKNIKGISIFKQGDVNKIEHDQVIHYMTKGAR